jgi:hypothetical protein
VWRISPDDADGGWTKVDDAVGAAQIYQPGSGVVFLAGTGSMLGTGVLRSDTAGAPGTWMPVGVHPSETVVFGTSKNVYAMSGVAVSSGPWNPSLEMAPQPGMSGWSTVATPGLTQGPAQVAVTTDGTHAIVVAACFQAGLWRYVEP